MTWCCEVPCEDTSRIQPRASWSCLHGIHPGQRPSFRGTGYRSWWGGNTSGDFSGRRPRRHGGWRRRLRYGRNLGTPWLEWHVGTRRPHMRACRSPSSRSGPSFSASPRAHITPGPLSGYQVPDPQEGNHCSSCQAGWYPPPRPYSDRRGELDGFLCHKRTLHRSAPRDGQVQVMGSWPPYGGG